MNSVIDPMKPEQKKKWVAALRSGKYKQTKAKLKNANQYGYYYCCLGVANEVLDIKSTSSEVLLKGDKYCFLHKQDQKTLACMNDEGKSFNEIADYIEENL